MKNYDDKLNSTVHCCCCCCNVCFMSSTHCVHCTDFLVFWFLVHFSCCLSCSCSLPKRLIKYRHQWLLLCSAELDTLFLTVLVTSVDSVDFFLYRLKALLCVFWSSETRAADFAIFSFLTNLSSSKNLNFIFANLEIYPSALCYILYELKFINFIYGARLELLWSSWQHLAVFWPALIRNIRWHTFLLHHYYGLCLFWFVSQRVDLLRNLLKRKFF